MRRRVFFPQVPVVADWVMLTCMGKRDLYKKHKITHLNDVADTETVSDKLDVFTRDYQGQYSAFSYYQAAYFSFRLLMKYTNFQMCYFGFDATSSHTMSCPQQYLIGNTSQLIAYEH